MGNCLEKKQPQPPPPRPPQPLSTPPPQKIEIIKPPSTPPPPQKITPSNDITTRKHDVTLCGDPTNPATHYLRFTLLYKPITLRFFPSQMPLSLFTLRFSDDDPLSGPYPTLLRLVDSKLPQPPFFDNARGGDPTAPDVVRMAALQHKSLRWHLERMVRWGVDLATRGGNGNGKVGVVVVVDPSVGTPRMEVGKFGKSYGKLLEVLLEHAQMEERVVFPILHAADRGVVGVLISSLWLCVRDLQVVGHISRLCRCVNEEHARDLPIMNGIKEDIKSIVVLDSGSATCREALRNLSARLEMLQENCREHFDEEERNLFPLMEATDLTREQHKKVVEQCIDVMQGTHSHLFRFFIEGLLPHEAMEYLELIMNCVDKEKANSVLRILVD